MDEKNWFQLEIKKDDRPPGETVGQIIQTVLSVHEKVVEEIVAESGIPQELQVFHCDCEEMTEELDQWMNSNPMMHSRTEKLSYESMEEYQQRTNNVPGEDPMDQIKVMKVSELKHKDS